MTSNASDFYERTTATYSSRTARNHFSGKTRHPLTSIAATGLLILLGLLVGVAQAFPAVNDPIAQSSPADGRSAGKTSSNMIVVEPPTIGISFSPTTIALNATSTLSFSLYNTEVNPVTLTGVAFTDTLPTGLTVSNSTTTVCGGTLTTTAPTGIELSGASIAVSNVCQFDITVTGTASGQYFNTTGVVTSTDSGPGTTASASLTVASPPTIAKAFGDSTILLNGSTTLTFTLTNPNPDVILTGISFTDNLPFGLQVAATPGVVNTCGGTFEPTSGDTTLTLINGVIASGPVKRARPAIPLSSCTISLNVTGTTGGIKINTTGAISSVEGGAGTTSNTAVLTVVAPPTIEKAFGASAIPLNGSTTLSFTITNPNSFVSLTGISFTDSLPSGLQVAATPGVANSCGGTFAPAPGDTTLTFTGGLINSAPTKRSGAAFLMMSCTISVNVTGTTLGVKNNTTGVISSVEGGTGTTSNTATLTVASPPTIAKAFGASTIPLNASTPLTFTIVNPNPDTILSGVSFTDSLPSGLQVAASPDAVNGCGGTFTPISGDVTLTFTGGSLGSSPPKRARPSMRGNSCTISVNVTGTTAGTKNNTTGTISSVEGGTGTTSNTATLTVVAPPTITKAFGASTILLNGSTTLTFTITNPNPWLTLTGIGFTDGFPSGLQVAATPGIVNSCGGTFAPASGDTTLTFTDGIITSGVGKQARQSIPTISCTISVNVTGTSVGFKYNTTGTISSVEGETGTTSNTATLTVAGPPTIAKAFGASSVPLNGSTTLTFTITNPNAEMILNGISFTDNLPSGLQVAATPGVVNSCGGTFAPASGDTALTLTGGSIDSEPRKQAGFAMRLFTCRITVSVTGTTAGVKNNITGVISSTEGGTGTTSNTATLTVVPPPVLSKSFNPPTTAVNGASTLSFTITNPAGNTVSLTGVSFSDNFPAGLIVATPNGLTGSCGDGTITATAGSGAVSLSEGTLAAASSCTFSVNVTPTSAGSKNNITGAVTSNEGGTGNTASSTLSTEQSDLQITKRASTPTVAGGSNVIYTLEVTNLGPSAATRVSWSDPLPTEVTLVSIDAADGWKCGVFAGQLTCNKGDALAVNETNSFTVTAKVNCGLADGTAINNSATVTSSGNDPAPANNTATATVTVSNAGTTLLPVNAQFRSRGGQGTVLVTPSSSCPWTAVSNAAFLTIVSGAGLGPGTVSYSVTPHSGTTSRTGTLTIAGQTFTVTQTAANAENSQTGCNIPGEGDCVYSTTGSDQTTQTGYGLVQAVGGKSDGSDASLSALYGTAVFSLTQNDTVVSEAGVPASPPTTAAVMFIDFRPNLPAKTDHREAGLISINTGLAVANPGTTAANLVLTLRSGAGETLATGHAVLGEGNHQAMFVDQLPQWATDFVFPSDFGTETQLGTLSVTSDQPVSMVALRLTLNQRGETLLTTTPVADMTQAATSAPLNFAQVADGGNFTTALVLMNPGAAVETGTIRLFQNDGTPLAVHRVGDPEGTASTFSYSIPARGLYVLQTDGAPSVINTGSAQVIPDAGMTAPAGAGLFRNTPIGTLASSQVVVSESGVPAALPTTHALIYLDQSQGHLTGLALAAPTATPVEVSLRALQTDGATVVGTGSVTLVGNGHDARFAQEYISNLPADFTGVLEITAPTPVVVLTLRGLTNRRGEFLMTTFPVADFNRAAPVPILFPQIADGGGFQTQIILLNAGLTPQNVTTRYLGDDGLPLDVAK
ncbi:MAG: DUF11 domain-containing protein [Acidobacteriia bacterium]|nr:DUF11 domain-containing protein [Terriglobia bacterium]